MVIILKEVPKRYGFRSDEKRQVSMEMENYESLK